LRIAGLRSVSSGSPSATFDNTASNFRRLPRFARAARYSSVSSADIFSAMADDQLIDRHTFARRELSQFSGSMKIADVVSDDRITESRDGELEHHVVARIAEERPPQIEDLLMHGHGTNVIEQVANIIFIEPRIRQVPEQHVFIFEHETAISHHSSGSQQLTTVPPPSRRPMRR